MIKSLRDTRIADGLPRVLTKQPWAQALSKALGTVHERTMGFADGSQIYTDVDNLAENILDALAVNWKIDWYDTSYSAEQKRRIIKTALSVRRTMGTAAAVKAQADAIYPGTTLEEWFQWGGQPGTFRLHVDITATDAEHPIEFYTKEEIEQRLATAKRFSAQLESMSYQITHGIKVRSVADLWRVTPPVCGMVLCGTYPTVKALGWSEQGAIGVAGMPEALAASPELCGTLPEPAMLGHALEEKMCSGGNAVTAYALTPPVSGVFRCGAKP